MDAAFFAGLPDGQKSGDGAQRQRNSTRKMGVISGLSSWPGAYAKFTCTPFWGVCPFLCRWEVLTGLGAGARRTAGRDNAWPQGIMYMLKGGEPMATQTRHTALIVDDSEISREILKNIFSAHYAIEEARDGEEGLQKILQDPERYSLLLLDVVMPNKSGLEVLRELNRRELTNAIPVFLITGETNSDILREAYELGVMDVIGKPVVPYIVLRRVQSVVELFVMRKNLADKVHEQQQELLSQAQQIIELNNGLIASLSTAIEFRNGESGEHVRRIHDITLFMFTKTQFAKYVTPSEAIHIAMASIMHDVGKIAIPDAILNKPGRLTREEYEVMKTHTVQGAQLLEKIPQLRRNMAYKYARDIAMHHHERWDGRGYPDGLKGNECSLEAQIVGLADVYDALLSKRVYKDALPPEEALRMMRDGECGVFNPDLVQEFMAMEKDLRPLVFGSGRDFSCAV